MSEHERIQELNHRLQELESRTVADWERPILEVAKLAVLREIATMGRRLARWGARIAEPEPQTWRRPRHLSLVRAA